jgi:ATP phosphoribosyltransferase regulatory subunit
MPRWLLPENISDVLPREARRIEALRRALLDLYAGYGYELVIPPLIEYIDSLLTGSGLDLDLRTFKLVDQSSGRMLGLRADTTPQVARIDAHILNRAGVTRLCYAASVLHARPQHPLAVREPLQVGAELYGAPGAAADLEVLELAVASLRVAGLPRVCLDLGHTGVVRALLDMAELSLPVEDEILAALSTKDMPALQQTVAALPAPLGAALLAVARLNGGIEVLASARRVLPDHAAIASALDTLESLARRCGADRVSVDLADLHGYRYHSGLTFAVHAPEAPSAVLRGGRYDNIGKAFGRARPAVGFSIYLREVVGLLASDAPRAILAPAVDDAVDHAGLRAAIAALRRDGVVVVQRLPDEPGRAAPGDFIFDRELRFVNASWQVVARDASLVEQEQEWQKT